MECGEEDDAPATYLTTMEQREKEELEFYTDLAVQEMQRWIEVCDFPHLVVTFSYVLHLPSAMCCIYLQLCAAFTFSMCCRLIRYMNYA